jgi:hypothetical protein
MNATEIHTAALAYNAEDMEWVQAGQSLTLAERIPAMRPVVRVTVPDHRGMAKRVFVAIAGLMDDNGLFIPATDEKAVRMSARLSSEVASKAQWWGRKAFDWTGEVVIAN